MAARRTTVLALAVAAALLTALAPAGASAVGDHGPLPRVTPAAKPAGVMGTVVSRVDCRTPGAVAGPPARVPGPVTAYVVCPGPGTGGVPVRVRRAASPWRYGLLARAFWLPGVPPVPNQVCPAMPLVFQPVFGVTATRTWLLEAPTTSCGFPRPEVTAAIGRALSR